MATHPQAGDRALEHDVELAKAALLYADEVEMVGLGVAMFENVRRATSGDRGMFGLLRELDDEALAFVTGQGGAISTIPPNWRDMLDLIMSPNLQTLMAAAPEEQRANLESVLAGMEDMNAEARPFVTALLEEAGASELAEAIDQGVVRVAELPVDVSYLFRGRSRRAEETSTQVEKWVAALTERLNDRKTRLLFDDASAELIQTMIRDGRLERDETTMRLARQAALGTGLVARLPAFPQAPMGELLDLRSDLAVPLERYRGAVVRYSKGLPDLLGSDLDFEIGQLWEEEVHPSILDIQQHMVDHSLVRELGRSVDAKEFAKFTWTAGASVGVGTTTDLRGALLGAVIATGNLTYQTAVDAARRRGVVQRESASQEMYILYEANRRLS